MKKDIKQSRIVDGMAMNQYFRQFTLAAISMAIVQAASAQVAINSIVPMNLGAQGTELRVIFDGLPPQPKAYQLEQPARLVLDFEQTKQNLKQSNIPLSGNEATSVQVMSDPQRARMIVNLKQVGAFTTRVEGNTFILKMNSTNLSLPAVKEIQPQAVQRSSVLATGLANISFQRGGQEEGQVLIDLSSSNTPVDVQQQGNKILVRMLGNKVPTALIRRLNVGEFATPINQVDAYNDGNTGVITIETVGPYEYMAFQAEKRLTVSVKRPEQNNAAKLKTAQSYSGKKISLDFQDIEVRRVLQLLADFTGINMVTADSVSGNITLRLKDVPWDQALDIILRTKNLDKRRNGDVIWIAPVSELLKSEEEEARVLAQNVKMAALQTEYIQLNYAKATDIAELIRSSGTNSAAARATAAGALNATDTSTGSLLSTRGALSIDNRTNTLIVTDTAQKIEQIRKMINLLDVSVKQVLIEARIVRASTNFTKEMGVKWAVLSQGILNNNNLLVGGSDTTLFNLRDPDDEGRYTIERPSNLNVDLGVTTAGASRIAFGLISLSDFMLDLELSALQADGYGEVISTPKVMTADKQKAKVASGQQIPYTSTATSGGGQATNTEFKDAVLSLDVTPSITPDGKVSMQLNITSDSPAGTAPNGEIILNKNEINTNVLVSNGETVVLGGIFEQESSNSQTKVPFLGDIPYVGQLFRRDSKTDNKRELLIFVTPRIVNDTEVRNH